MAIHCHIFRHWRRRCCTTLTLPPFVFVGVAILILEVDQTEEPLHLVPVHIHPPIDLVRGAHDAVQIPLIDHQVEGAIRERNKNAVTVLPLRHHDGRVRGGYFFAVVLFPVSAATVTLDHLTNRHPQTVKAENRLEPRPL